MIGGIIVLGLFLTALGTMVFVGQQYDSYQTTVDRMSQYDIQRFSESLVANYPGLSLDPNPVTCSGSSTGQCNQYEMTLSNVGGLTNAGSSNGGISGSSGGGVGTSIARVYINSTLSGCTQVPCILNAANNPAAYSFRASDGYLNPGEFNHVVLLWLPSSVTLPNPNPPSPSNTIWIVTSRGRVFSFQWPFPPVGTALGVGTFSTGIMKIAYQGAYGSQNEGSGSNGYCHNEPSQFYPASPGYKELLTSITGAGVTNNQLTFVNPWITDTILQTVYANQPTTTLYIYAKAINIRTSSMTVKGGNLVISTAQSGANAKVFFLGGSLLGTYYKGFFWAVGSSATIQPNDSFYLIFKITSWTQNIASGAAGLVFTGTAAFTNQNQDQYYSGGELLLDGLYDRTSCTP